VPEPVFERFRKFRFIGGKVRGLGSKIGHTLLGLGEFSIW